MPDDQFKRKLTAILSADVEGYSRLMSLDDTETVKTLKTCRSIISRLILNHNGRVVDSPGDNIMAEFVSVVDAVKCSLEIQDEIKQNNDALPSDRQMVFRIGVNLGDVIEDGDRIYGDGVNIAARLEGFANGGGICISGNTYEQIQNKVPVGCKFIGKQTVKNIANPVPVYRIWKDPHATVRTVGTAVQPKPKKIYLTAAAAAIVLIAAVAVFMNHTKIFTLLPTGDEVARPYLSLSPAKATIAVLPFDNLSDDPDQEYFSDGITNDIITDLSKFRELAVTASNTVFKYKGKSPNIKELGNKLNAKYILEGSIQKAGDQVRINAQLIDTATGNHIWAHRFNRKIEDIFELQDEIIETIVRKLALKVHQSELDLAMSKSTDSLEAYDYYLRADHHYYQPTREGKNKARQLFQKAIELDPNFASAYVGLARVRTWAVNFGFTEFPNIVLQEALDLTKKAVQLDDSNASARAEMGYIYMRFGEYDIAKGELQKAIDLNPNDWISYRRMGAVLLYSGHPDESLEWFRKRLEFDPYLSPGTYMNIGIAHYLKGDDDKAIDWLKEAATKWPNFLGCHLLLASIYGNTNQMEKAEAEKAEILRISPFFKVNFYGQAYKNPAHRDKIVAGLRKAGLS
jgi:adenylate cyclase